MPKAAATSLDDVLASFRACAPVFTALGDRYRQDIVMLLAAQERLNVMQITERLDTLSRPTVSHHLKVLLDAGMVEMERVSRENFYRLTLDHALADLRRLVEQAEAGC